FDFISYSRDSGFEITILPPVDGVLIHLELRDPDTGYFEHHAITDSEAGRCSNIDTYTGQILDTMAARIGRKKAQLYADRHKSQKRQEMEKFWKQSRPSKLTEEK
ncbi:MAG: hypothetical protein II464_00550, partial [Oscillospiraceae bacterium]|nr:hypothetical protein [Oscillospiraceae bacterium]